ncbi:NfeD family protein [bacterium]|nr:NfeD family protein [bacterium]
MLPYLPYMWIAVGVALLIVEFAFAREFTLWLSIDAFIVAILAFVGIPLYIQLIVVVFLAVVLCALSKRLSFLTLHPLEDTQSLRVNSKEIVGKRGVVVVSIRGSGENGLVVLDGTKWVAGSHDDQDIPLAAEVEVVSMKGLRVLVRPT